MDRSDASRLDAELRALLDHEAARALRSVPGRVTFRWSDGARDWAVKRTDRDLSRDAWFDRLHGAPGRSPGQREYDNLLGLAREGLPVPEAVGWARDGRRSLVAMRWVDHADDLRAAVQRDPEGARSAWLRPLVELVARLHGAGWYHRDLYLQHFVLAAARGLVLLDVGRARRQRRPRRRWLEKDLAALAHSAPDVVGPRLRLRFLLGYLRARGVSGRGAARRWARAVERRRARLARHVPRDERA